MTEHPILFSGPMVRAILAGRKTQTRRVVKPQPSGATPGVYADLYNHGPEWAFWLPDYRMTEPRTWRCPYGTPGDSRLWVRETWCEAVDPLTSQFYDPPRALYAADGHEVFLDDGDGGHTWNKDGTMRSPWKPSIHMPRWASRLTLEVTGVRVERLQAIGVDDVLAEGLDFEGEHAEAFSASERLVHAFGAPRPAEVYAFALGWDTINGKRPGCRWDDDPWVWVLTFRVLPEGARGIPADGREREGGEG